LNRLPMRVRYANSAISSAQAFTRAISFASTTVSRISSS